MSYLDIAVWIALAGLLILASFSVLQIILLLGKGWLKAAVIPYAQRGIHAGFYLALKGVQQLQVRLDGEDKAKIANSIYDAIPDWVALPFLPIPVHVSLIKLVVGRDQFEVIVEDVYRAEKAFVQKNEAYLQSQIDAFDAIVPSQATTNTAQAQVGG